MKKPEDMIGDVGCRYKRGMFKPMLLYIIYYNMIHNCNYCYKKMLSSSLSLKIEVKFRATQAAAKGYVSSLVEQ